MPFATIENIYEIYLQCGNKVCTDSRNIQNGSLFICLKGPSFNGNRFATEALQKGAKYVISDEKEYVTDPKILLVGDCLKTLQELAALHRKSIPVQILGIGGSNGKTTTKELCFAVVSSAFKTHATTANLNNHIGVPMTILELTGNEDLAIVEMGTNHPGEMKVLCDITNPDFGIVTNVGKEHLEGFGDLEGVAREESELFLNLIQNRGIGFVNVDDAWLGSMSKRMNHSITYGIENAADVQGRVLQSMPTLKYEISFRQKTYGPFDAQIGGVYNFYNILSAFALGFQLGMQPDAIGAAVAAYHPTNNRSEWLKLGKYQILLDAYNANPSSMSAALEEFAKLPGTKAVMLGDMLELGTASELEHLQIFDLCKSLNLDEIYLCGNEFGKVAGAFPQKFEQSAELYHWLSAHPTNADYILIKGSRGMKMETVLQSFQKE
ncbi:MAG: UDP-N-acetylmuramoyl-tripeptide--D-alanyl-D-alanine ligase [Bacteroidetes bacterium]|nr:UDP-N-acetylmuramoyl-tripeptide--D-alanyl-D-alanine ligase [Bacteroidota bacterium]